MENSVRRKKDHRKQKRDEIKERKIKEKEQKMVGVKLKKKLKKKEIEDKIEELKKLTGNDQLAFEVSMTLCNKYYQNKARTVLVLKSIQNIYICTILLAS